jgi:zinc/manganese transport system ATP-binding protein
MTAIAFEQVTIALGGRAILSDVSLDISEGEFVGVLGANGSGKTTLLRAILGLVAASAGRIAVLGQPAERGNPAIGYLPQMHGANVRLGLTGREFLASAVRGHRWGLPLLSRDDWRELDQAIDMAGAAAIARRPLNALSGGERQRLFLAQALLGRPRVLLLDEPLISLDPAQQAAAIDLVRRVARELRLTVLFTAHELNQLLPAIDRVLYLGNGHAALGTVDEVVTPTVMSRLYGAPIDVVRVGGRIFVLSNGHDVEHQPHAHDDHDDHHEHAGHDHARV